MDTFKWVNHTVMLRGHFRGVIFTDSSSCSIAMDKMYIVVHYQSTAAHPFTTIDPASIQSDKDDWKKLRAWLLYPQVSEDNTYPRANTATMFMDGDRCGFIHGFGHGFSRTSYGLVT